MNEMDIKLVITDPLGQETVLKLQACVIGGFMDDELGAGIGAYFGRMDYNKAMLSIIQAIRAHFKIMDELVTEEIKSKGLDHIVYTREERLADMKKMALEALEQAFQDELENHAEDNIGIQEHKERVMKMRFDRGSQ